MTQEHDITAQAVYKNREADRKLMEIPVDITLPDAPSEEVVNATWNAGGGRILVYTHVPLTESSKSELIHQMATAVSGDVIFDWAPHYDQTGQPLSHSYQRHLEHAQSGSRDYYWNAYVAAVHPDWRRRGLLVVNVTGELMEESENQDRQYQEMFSSAELVDLMTSNIQVGRSSWQALRTIQAEYQVDSPGHHPPDLQVLIPYHIAVYTAAGIDADAVLRALGKWEEPPKGSAHFFPFRLMGTIESPFHSTRVEHLHRSLLNDNSNLHSTLCIFADKQDLENYGVQLLQIRDANPDDGGPKSRHTLRPNYPLTRRIPASFQTTFLHVHAVTCGRDPMQYTTPLFIGQNVYASKMFEQLNSVLKKPVHILSAPNIPYPPVKTDKRYLDVGSPRSLEDAIQLFPLLCKEERFQPNVSKRYFVYCPGWMRSARKRCLIMRVDWAGANKYSGADEVWDRSAEELWALEGLADKAEVMRCNAAEVDELLLQLADEKREQQTWEGEVISDEVRRWAGVQAGYSSDLWEA